MKSELLSLLAAPGTGGPLEYGQAPGAGGVDLEALVEPWSGRRFPIREGLPDFVAEEQVTGLNRKYRDLYDGFSPFYDLAQRAFYAFRGGEAKARGTYLSALEVKPSDRVLEVSVGTGANVRLLPRNATYYGLDLSWEQLRQCRRNLRRAGREAELVRGEAEHLPFRDEVFDVVFHMGGINFFNDRGRAIREMVRVAKPGTKLVIVDETEKLARQAALLSPFFRNRKEVITAPVEFVPPEMEEIAVTEIRNGELYLLSFRKPR